jgi:hypothetical protein
MVSENRIPHLVAYGKDCGLLDTRRLILKLGRLHLDTVTKMANLTSYLESGLPYCLIILCHTVPDSERQSVYSLARKMNLPVYQLRPLTRPEDFRESVLRLLGSRHDQDCFHEAPESTAAQLSQQGSHKGLFNRMQ